MSFRKYCIFYDIIFIIIFGLRKYCLNSTQLLLALPTAIIASVYYVAWWSKVRAPRQFAATIRRFALVPPAFSYPLAQFLLLTELTTAVLLTFGRLHLGLGLASFQFGIFTVALASVIWRDINTSCNCFGTHTTSPVTWWTVIRTAALLSVTVMTWGIATFLMIPSLPIGIVLMCMPIGMVGVLLALNLDDIFQLLQA